MNRLLSLLLATALLAGCETTPVADVCGGPLSSNLDQAVSDVESRLASGCEYQFDSYFDQLLAIAENDPAAENRKVFSDHLIAAKNLGVISQRQARERYNRYFNIKFVSLTGDYNTCSQACPDRRTLLMNMKRELGDKERGLLRISKDQASFYRADVLLKEADLVLEATCRACEAGALGAR
ncbi:MAG: hypothetical protein AAF648_01485 [Pseudomonadota bacterium]